MTVEGPVVPRRYINANSVAPTPPIDTFELGEVITCCKTGRMWVNNGTTPLAVSSESSVTSFYGETLSGFKPISLGNPGFETAGTQAYGFWVFPTSVQMSSGANITGAVGVNGTVSIAGASVNAFSVATNLGTAVNDITLTGNHVRFCSPTIGAGVSATKFHQTITSSGFAFVDFSTDANGTSRTTINASGVSTTGLTIPGIVSSWLNTNGSGTVSAAPYVPAPNDASYLCLSSSGNLTNERVLNASNHMELTSTGTDAYLSWRYNPKIRSIVESECNAAGNLTTSITGTGASVTYGSTGSGNYQSLATFTTGTTSTGRSHLGSATVTSVVFGSGQVKFTTFVRLTQLSASGSSQAHVIRAGFYDQLDTGAMGDGCWFEYTDNVNSGRWTCNVTNSGSAYSFVDSGITVAANTWYRLEVTMNAAASRCTFTIDGTDVYEASSALPTGTPQTTGFGVTMRKTSGTTAHTAQVDYIGVTSEVTR